MSELPAGVPQTAANYESFLVPAFFAPWAEVLLKKAPPRTGDHVLDLACGTGIVARMAAPAAGSAGRVVGLDLRPGMLAAAASLPSPPGAPIEWIVADAVSPGLAPESFDLVLCQAGLQFFSDRAAALRSARRVLRPGGRIAVSVWQGLDRQPVFRALAEAEIRHLAVLGLTEEEATQPFCLGDPGELRRLLQGAGFSDIDVTAHVLDVRVPSLDDFVPRVESGYTAVMPQFIENPAAFEDFVAAVNREMNPVLERYRDRDGLAFPMHANIAVARR